MGPVHSVETSYERWAEIWWSRNDNRLTASSIMLPCRRHRIQDPAEQQTEAEIEETKKSVLGKIKEQQDRETFTATAKESCAALPGQGADEICRTGMCSSIFLQPKRKLQQSVRRKRMPGSETRARISGRWQSTDIRIRMDLRGCEGSRKTPLHQQQTI